MTFRFKLQELNLGVSGQSEAERAELANPFYFEEEVCLVCCRHGRQQRRESHGKRWLSQAARLNEVNEHL